MCPLGRALLQSMCHNRRHALIVQALLHQYRIEIAILGNKCFQPVV